MLNAGDVCEALNVLRTAWGWKVGLADLESMASVCGAAWSQLDAPSVLAACRALATEHPHKCNPLVIRDLVLARALTGRRQPARTFGACECGAPITASSGECSRCLPCWKCGVRSVEFARLLPCPSCGESFSTRTKRNLMAELEAKLAEPNS